MRLKPRLRKGKEPMTMPRTFTPRTFEEADGRRAIVKRMKKRVAELLKAATRKNVVTEKLAEQAAFIEMRLDTIKVNDLEGNGSVKEGSVVQLNNTLRQLYGDMGILPESEDEQKKPNLVEYLATKAAAK